MPADEDPVGELAFTRLAHEDPASRCRGNLVGFHVDIALGPRGEQLAGVERVFAARQKMVGGVERDETLRVLCGREYFRCVVDVDDGVARRMHHHERFSHPRDDLAEPVPPYIVQKLLLDAERAPGEFDLRFAFALDGLRRVPDQTQHVLGFERRADRGHGGAFWNVRRGGEHRGPTETMTDQDRRRAIVLAQKIGRGDEVADVRGKIGVGEVAFAPTQAGEVEPQHGDAMLGERGADVGRRLGVLRAGKAMGEQGVRERRFGGRVQPRRKRGAGFAGKADRPSVGCHGRSLLGKLPSECCTRHGEGASGCAAR